MKDLLLGEDGDLYLTDTSDVVITDSVRQAIRIRLLWFLSEWRLGPSLGVPYYEDFFVKRGNMLKMRADIRAALMSVEEVTSVNSLTITVNPQTWTAKVLFSVSTTEGVYKSEVELWQHMASRQTD